jgi:hypothetical protein
MDYPLIGSFSDTRRGRDRLRVKLESLRGLGDPPSSLDSSFMIVREKIEEIPLVLY